MAFKGFTITAEWLAEQAQWSWNNVIDPKHIGPCPIDDGRYMWHRSAAWACAYRRSSISPKKAVEFIWNSLPAGYKRLSYQDVVDTVAEAYGCEGNFTPSQGSKKGSFPKPDVEATKAVVSRYGALDLCSFRYSIRNESEDFSQYEMLEWLFYPKALVCVGPSFFYPRIDSLEYHRDKDLSALEFIVPNQMSKRSGKTKDGKDGSVRCDDTVGDRRWLVIEFDFEAVKDGKPTIWADAIMGWYSIELSPKDASARLLQHLVERFGYHLGMIVDSGNKSIHGWFWVRDLEESKQREFMSAAARLGADTALCRKSQWVRFPGGRRADGRIQPVVYFNPINPN